jgi:hypothetical protein
MNNPKQKVKESESQTQGLFSTCADDGPIDRSPDAVLPIISPVLVSQTQDSVSAALYSVTPSPQLSVPQPIIPFADDGPSLPTTTDLVTISNIRLIRTKCT